jgi:DNA polymerase I-like protein with 3'-5' exonuclease and polymerase domains
MVSLAIDLSPLPRPALMAGLWAFLLKRKVVAHNFWFEGAIIYRFAGALPEQFSCTRLLFKMLASEGWLGQSWGLKEAMVDILNWPVNTTFLNEWLKQNKKTAAQMSDAPWHILGWYNQLDAAATYELWQCFTDTLESGNFAWKDYFVDYIQEAYSEYRQLLTSNHVGIPIDQEALLNYKTQIERNIVELSTKFLTDVSIVEYITKFNKNVVEQLLEKEPPSTTASGKPSTRHAVWKAKLEVLMNTNHFNLDSPKHLQWLLYGQLKLSPPDTTEKGDPSVDKTSLKMLSSTFSPLKSLLEYRTHRDVLKFLVSLESSIIDGMYRPSYKVPGPVTSRLSCGVE